MEGKREYSLIIREGNDSSVKAFDRGLEKYRGLKKESEKRGFVDGLIGLYRTSLSGQIINASQSLLESGVNAIANAVRSKKNDWRNAVSGEAQFVRVLPMQTEILDFYSKTSNNGPLDPSDMYFSGFGCRQVIKYKLPNGKDSIQEVFYISCKLRDDQVGYTRMLHHSKFEVYVDSLRFAPYLCELPNDSLGIDTDKRIDFSFDTRKNLTFNVHASITSSWINQAMQVMTDVPLGEFDIVANIDSTKLDDKGIYVYSRHADPNPEDNPSLIARGDCFLVPRSYIGTTDMNDTDDCWGTGQYKVEMRITETCQINDDYYATHKNAWKSEWNKIKSRKKKTSIWRQALCVVSAQYVKDDAAWVTTFLDPLKTYIVTTESGLLKIAGSNNTGTSTVP
jgi:hypothetical protein